MPTNYNSSVCFFPDGITDGTHGGAFVPCDPSAAVSACCPVGTSCLPSGLCLQEGGVLRGACTDQTWKADECPTVCTATGGIMEGAQNSYSWLTRCAFAPAYKSFTWACGLGANCSEKDVHFPLQLSNPTFLDITGLVVGPGGSSHPPTSIPTHVAPDESSTASNASSNGNRLHDCKLQDPKPVVSPVVMGASIGGPLLFLLILALATAMWYRRKWMRARKVVSIRHGQISDVVDGISRTNSGRQALELLAKRTYHAQLDGIQPAVHEMRDDRSYR